MKTAKNFSVRYLEEMTGMSKATVYNMRYNDTRPEVESVIALGIGFGLNVEQMELFLYKAGYSLCPSFGYNRYYIHVIQCVGGEGHRRVIDCNEMLQELGVPDEKLLGRFRDKI